VGEEHWEVLSGLLEAGAGEGAMDDQTEGGGEADEPSSRPEYGGLSDMGQEALEGVHNAQKS
jgi:hypothetical protein